MVEAAAATDTPTVAAPLPIWVLSTHGATIRRRIIVSRTTILTTHTAGSRSIDFRTGIGKESLLVAAIMIVVQGVSGCSIRKRIFVLGTKITTDTAGNLSILYRLRLGQGSLEWPIIRVVKCVGRNR